MPQIRLILTGTRRPHIPSEECRLNQLAPALTLDSKQETQIFHIFYKTDKFQFHPTPQLLTTQHATRASMVQLFYQHPSLGLSSLAKSMAHSQLVPCSRSNPITTRYKAARAPMDVKLYVKAQLCSPKGLFIAHNVRVSQSKTAIRFEPI